jgi:hypothetical protein
MGYSAIVCASSCACRVCNLTVEGTPAMGFEQAKENPTQGRVKRPLQL